MASFHDICCGVCEAKHVSKSADHWCPECDEGLCAVCQNDYHRLSKGTRYHEVISIDDYKRIPTGISDLGHHCTKHNKRWQMYCHMHDSICCPVCVSSDHKNCKGLSSIDELARNSKCSSLLEHLQQTVENMQLNFQKIISDRKQNMSSLQNERQVFHEKVKQIRKEINRHLDQRQEQLVNEMDNAIDTENETIEKFLSNIESRSDSLDQLQNHIEAVKKYGTDLQAFIGNKAFQERIQIEESYMKSLLENENMQQISLEYKVPDDVSNMTNYNTVFGNIAIKRGRANVVISVDNRRHAQNMVLEKTKDIEAVSLTLLKKFQIPAGEKDTKLAGCTICNDGRLVFTDCNLNKRLVIMNKQGLLEKVISVFPSLPLGITAFGESIIAFTTESPSQIRIMDISSSTLIRTVKGEPVSYGITQRQDKVIFTCNRTDIRILGPNVKSSLVYVKPKYSSPWNTMVASDMNLYYTDYHSNTVTCFQNGEEIWHFQEKDVLQSPIAITQDSYSNLYVACTGNDTVVGISADGKRNKKLLTVNDGLRSPRAICFDAQNEHLIVAMFAGDVFLYSVS